MLLTTKNWRHAMSPNRRAEVIAVTVVAIVAILTGIIVAAGIL